MSTTCPRCGNPASGNFCAGCGAALGQRHCTECGAAAEPAEKQSYIDAGIHDTVRSRSWTGKPARMLRSKWTDEWDSGDCPGFLPMPLQGMLVMEANLTEARRVAEFFARIGLPIHLGQLNLSAEDATALRTVAKAALGFAPIHNLPFEVTESVVYEAILGADAIGVAVAEEHGDQPYQALQAGD